VTAEEIAELVEAIGVEDKAMELAHTCAGTVH